MLAVALHNPVKVSVNHFESGGKSCASLTLECKNGDHLDIYLSPDAADALKAAWDSLPVCDTCKERVESVDEANDCELCVDARIRTDYAKWRPIYDSEKRAGLLRPQSELDAELRDAGRGHLVRP